MTDILANAMVEYAAKLSFFRRLPVLGTATHYLSYKLVPADRLTWIQIRRGAGKGLWLQLHPRIARQFRDGEIEPAVQECLLEQLRPGMVVYDLGANVGLMTLIAARLVGAEGKVFAFEADHEVADRLRRNVERNALGNITVIERAVWSSTGTVHFRRSEASNSPGRGTGSVVPAGLYSTGTVAVRCTSLDAFIEDQLGPDFVKCDVEGAESEVFAGARALLAIRRPLILCEVHDAVNHSLLTQQFAAARYSVEWLEENHLFASAIA